MLNFYQKSRTTCFPAFIISSSVLEYCGSGILLYTEINLIVYSILLSQYINEFFMHLLTYKSATNGELVSSIEPTSNWLLIYDSIFFWSETENQYIFF